MRTSICLCVALTALPALAAPGEVQNVRWDSKTDLVWDAAAGAAGYHVYGGDLGGLSDNATCLIGNNKSESVGSDETIGVGGVRFYLIAAFDDVGQGSLGAGSNSVMRNSADSCVPSRRAFEPVPDGDPGDGVIDGDYPLRNPSVMTRHGRRETTGVMLHTGEFLLSTTDLAIPGRHLHWAFERTYRSQVDYDGPLGHNWDFNLNRRLAPLGTDVRHHDGSGRIEIFSRVTSTTFSSPAGRYAKLIENPDGSFTLREPDGVLRNFHAFDGSNVEGALESVEDRFGDRMTLHYDHQGLLTTVTDGLGRRIDLGYDAEGRLTSLTDYAGRTWVYSYDAAGDLVAARSPVVTGTPNGNDFPSGKTTGYSYSSGFADPQFNHCLLSVVAPNEEASGVPWIQVGYFTTSAEPFDQGRVDTWTLGGINASGIPAGGTIDLSYDSLNPSVPPDPVTPRRRTTMIDRNGNQRQYMHNHAGNRIEQTLFTNREVRPGEADYTTTWMYNGDGEVTQVTYPEGNQTLYTYDTPGADRYREGNLLEVRHVADSLRGDGHGGALNDIVTTQTYDAVYNRVLSRTEPRGNDSSYVPQNGGAQSADRYTTTTTYCHQEGDPSSNGLDDYATRFGIDLTGFPGNLGDVNNDGVTGRIFGTAVRVVRPAVALDAASNQAAIEGDTSQDSVIRHKYNPFAQLIETIDPEGNVHEFVHHPENDPDGDGTPTPTPPDGRTLDTGDGGYLASRRQDTTAGAGRNNGTDPAPADIETSFAYDAVGNLTHHVDGRGVLTRRIHNALNQVVELRRAAATADGAGPDGDPGTGRGEPGLAALSFKVRFEYDANDNLTARKTEDRNVDHEAGTESEDCVIWDISDGRVAEDHEASTGLVLTTEYRYDPNRNLIEVIRPEGNTDQRTYDERDLLHTTITGATGPRGGTAVVRTHDYDGNGNLTRVTDGRANPTDHEYDGVDRIARVIDEVGNTLEHFYDPAGHSVRRLNRGPVGGPTPLDRGGSTNVDLRDEEIYADEQGRLFRFDLKLFVPVGAAPGRAPVLTEGPLFPGDGAINMIFEYDRSGRRTFTIRDTNATSRTDYDGIGRPLATTLPDGSTDELTWDSQHNLVESAETELSSSSGVPAGLFLTTHFYDALGRREQVVDNLGQTTRYRYSSFDATVKVSDPNGPPGATIDRRSAAGSGMTAQTNEDGNVTDYRWDAAGRLLAVERTLTTTGQGNGTSTPPPDSTDPNNPDGKISISHVYDANSLLSSTQDDNGNTTSYAYDNLNRVTGLTFDDLTVSSYVYDQEHNVTQHTDPNGSVLTYTYDAANRSTQLSVARAGGIEGTTAQTFEYDGSDRLTRATDNNAPLDTSDDAEVQRIYDSLDRTVEEKQIYGTGTGAEKLVDLHWSADALLTEMVYPSGRVIQYGYDAADRLVSLGDPSRSEAASYEWFGLGRLHTRSYGNGVRMTMLDDAGAADIGWDPVRRVVELRHLDATDTVLAGFEHDYDRAGNRTHELRLHDENAAAGGFRGELWSFDSANRLRSFEEGTLDSTLNLIGPADDVQSWALDGVGNWAQMTRNGTTYDFSVNNLNEYDDPQSGGTRVDDGLADDAYDDAGTADPDGKNRGHDKNGNRTADDTLTYVYDFRSRLVSANTPDTRAIAATYAYDALNRRVFSRSFSEDDHRRVFTADSFSFGVEREMKESGEKGGTEDINIGVGELQECSVSQSDRVIEERDPTDTVTREIVYDADGPVWQILADGSSQYYHEDPRGNVVMLTAGAVLLPTQDPGDVLERYTYDAYGKPVFQDAGNQDKTEATGNPLAASDYDNTLLYGGLWYDPETGSRSGTLNDDFGGLYQRNGRYLDPDDGRTMTRSGVESDPGMGIVTPGFHSTGGDPDRPVITGRGYNGSGRYGFAGHAPVNLTGASSSAGKWSDVIILSSDSGSPAEFGRTLSSNGNSSQDAASGLPTGKRQHKPFSLPKPVDKSTPKLQELCGKGAHATDGGEFWFEGLRPGHHTADGEFWFEGLRPGHHTADGEFWFTDLKPGHHTADDGEFWFTDLKPGHHTADGEFWFMDLEPGHHTADGEFWFTDLKPGHHTADGEFWFEDLPPGLHSASDARSSCWIRVGQPHASKDMILKGKKILQN